MQAGYSYYTLQDLEMPDKEPMVIIRSSLLWICDNDKYAAAALNMYLHWTRWIMKHRQAEQETNTERKRQGKQALQDTNLTIYRKQSLFVKDLLNFCNEKRLRQANALLVKKGLLKVSDTPRAAADHILKYELQIDRFKELMQDWRTFRGNHALGEDDGVVEVALEEDSDGTDKSPRRNGQITAPERTNHRAGTDKSPLLIGI
jgi:hypothetical protein